MLILLRQNKKSIYHVKRITDPGEKINNNNIMELRKQHEVKDEKKTELETGLAFCTQVQLIP